VRGTTAAIGESLYKKNMLTVETHPLLDLRAFETLFPRPLGEMGFSSDLLGLLSLSAQTPFQTDDTVREVVRSMLRHGGFKPAGRSKPASEYLIKAVSDGKLPPINVAVDACNVVSLHSGLPISVVDLDRVRPPLRVGIAQAGANYVFNAAGQTIDLTGLLCLFDAEGPCGNAVKDAQRTKTSLETRRTLSLIWGSAALPGRAAKVEAWYRSLLEKDGASTKPVEM
jgi:DNA/RNA-binding domain of Phe-tRNA-synthetase-like protein